MPDNRICPNPHNMRENICIDTYRIFDSCRDKDCFQNVKVYLTEFGEEIIEHTSAIRVKDLQTLSAYIDITEVPFNRGFYQLNIKIYVKLLLEACICQGNIQEFEGIAVVEKKVVLFGSEGNVNTFKSVPGETGFCQGPIFASNSSCNKLPTAVLEVADPIVLDIKVVEPKTCKCICCCCIDDIPEHVIKSVNGKLSDRDEKSLVVTLGFFSVVRLQRNVQIIVNASEFTVPEKQCIEAQENDPCALFRAMSFPIGEFSTPSLNNINCSSYKMESQSKGGCGCS